ncbi:MAG: hypothetical protein AAGG01_11105 [Planctomycetota bacterium]
MKVIHSSLFLFAGLFIASSAAASHSDESSRCEFTPRSLFERSADFTADPVPQIQAHFARVIERLEQRDVSGLRAEVLERRRAQIAELADYSAAGIFPRNEHLAIPSPVFIDAGGRACAVGHLMIESGAADLARRIRDESNLAYVPEIQVDGAAEWMESVGLTVEECAWIQPAYGCSSFGDIDYSGPTCSPTTPNSAGHLSELRACGSNDAVDNSVILFVLGLPEGSVGYFLNARAADAAVMPGTSQGTLCLSGSIGRHDAQIFSAFGPLGNPFGGTHWSGIVLDLESMPTPSGAAAVVPGDTWFFQAWYRDANPTSTSNLSDVISITFS